jgi:hypothetical protein
VRVAAAAAAAAALVATTFQATRNARLANANAALAAAQAAEARLRERADAEALFRGGQLAARAGQWRDALRQYERAERYADPVELGIHVIQALEGDRQHDRARAQVDKLRDAALHSRFKATFLLLDADLGVNRLEHPDRNLDLVRAALAIEAEEPGALSPADVAYARALLAEDTGDALGFLRQARASDPYHHRANGAYGMALLLLGELDEAGRFAPVFQALYPNDPEARYYGLAIAGFMRDQTAVASQAEAIGDFHGPGARRVARAIAGVADLLPWANATLRRRWVHGGDTGDVVADLLAVVGRLLPLLREVRELSPEEGELSSGEVLHRMVPSVARTYGTLVASVIRGPWRPERLLGALEAVGTSRVDAMIPALEGLIASRVRGAAAALDPVATAIAGRSLVFERSTLLVMGLVIACAACGEEHVDAGAVAAIRARARPWLDLLAREPGLGADELFLLHEAARILDAGTPLALEMGARFARAHPGDPRAKLALAEGMLDGGAIERARALVDEVEREAKADADLLARVRRRLEAKRRAEPAPAAATPAAAQPAEGSPPQSRRGR